MTTENMTSEAVLIARMQNECTSSDGVVSIPDFVGRVRKHIMSLPLTEDGSNKAWEFIHTLYLKNYDLNLFNLKGCSQDSLESIMGRDPQYNGHYMGFFGQIKPNIHLLPPDDTILNPLLEPLGNLSD